MIDTSELFRKLELYRNTADIPVAEIARDIGISRTTYYNWKKGYAPTNITTIQKAEKFLQERVTHYE